MVKTATARIRFCDIKPYDAPVSLDELRGPYDGPIDLPHAVRWQADRFDVNVSVPGWRRMAYQALVAEGTADEQRRLMNRARLIETWPVLSIDPRVRALWESRFPELRANAEPSSSPGRAQSAGSPSCRSHKSCAVTRRSSGTSHASL